ncbi:MAG: hypothetical protein K5898_00400 [Ruminococcus sp.]|uniref:hypothetical protein n=1 Tax=Ruminococcus sp. TaxID=41978 RepID=UPI0025F9884F|nr:hypothetical protein [Ruminococcus sp.]MCR4793646.1 hypothetical protein [Ruminococcus sp.]
MDGKYGLHDFFESSFAEDYIAYTEYLVRRSVTGISASCELLRELADKQGTKKDSELIEGIMTMCCELMRNAELSKALISDPDSKSCFGVVRTDAFLADLAANCGAVTAGRCRIVLGECSASLVRTDSNILRLLLLSFIRRYSLANDADINEFEAFCEETGKNVKIHIRASGTFVDGECIGLPDVFETYPDETVKGLAARIGAEAQMSGDEITAVIPLAEGEKSAVLEAPSPELGDTFFDPFNLMLRDIPHNR